MRLPQESLRPRTFLLCVWVLVLGLGLIHSEQIYSEAELTPEESATGSVFQRMAGPFRTLGEWSGMSKIGSFLGWGRVWLYDEPILLGTVRARAELFDSGTTVLPLVAEPVVSDQPLDLSLADVPTPHLILRPSKILVVGASSIQFALGRALERKLEGYPQLEVFRFGRFSSGLARPDYFDWIRKAEELLQEFHPDLVIAQIGGNDCQSLSDREGKLAARFGTDEWEQEFSRRIEEFASVFEAKGARIVLMGMPIMRSDRFSQRIGWVNRITESTGKRIGARYFSVWEATRDGRGRYQHTFVQEGRERTFRASDGIHLSDFGAEFVAEKITGFLEQEYGIG